MDDRVTLFIPIAHFHEEFLRQAVESVLAQTRADWQLLLVIREDKLNDVTAVLRAQLADPRVRVVDRTGRLLAGAYNSAMRAAKTDFIAALLGDDMLHPETVQVLGEHIRGFPDVDFFHTGRRFVDMGNRPLSSDYLPSLPVTRASFVESSPVKHLMCWRASLGLACGGVDESLNNHGSDDYDFPWVMLEHGARFHAIPRALYVFRDHRESFRLTTHVPLDVQVKETTRILEKHGVERGVIRRRLRTKRRYVLKQALFRNALHRWILERIGFDARRGWREKYR